MSELQDLYQEVILDHNKSPRNFKKLEHADHHAEGYNPLCGDRLDVYLVLEGDRIRDVSFLGSGCAISKASASLMTAAVKGKTMAEVENIFGKFHHMVTGGKQPQSGVSAEGGPASGGEANGATCLPAGTARAPWEDELGSLAAFSGVSEFPARVKCASLAWHTLKAALNGKHLKPVSTEVEGHHGKRSH